MCDTIPSVWEDEIYVTSLLLQCELITPSPVYSERRYNL